MDPRDPPNMLVHFYRASVMHADVWRKRLDATTNWAVVTTAAVITFAFGSRESVHFVVLLALVFDFFFLFMESRRYQAYHNWQRRIRALHRYLVAPAMRPPGGSPEEGEEDDLETGLAALGRDLGRTVPNLPLWAALGYRIRRNYGPLVTIVLLTWLLKLYVHPGMAGSLAEYLRRAGVGFVGGPVVLSLVGAFFAVWVILAIKAPTERMRDWSELPPPVERILPSGLRTGERTES